MTDFIGVLVIGIIVELVRPYIIKIIKMIFSY